jgi:hypothetical protein
VTTRSGAEGLQLGELDRLLVADEPDAIAERVVALYTDELLWSRVQLGLTAIAHERFSRRASRRALIGAMSQLGVAPPRGAFSAA